MACLGGARILGNRANPTPAAVFMIGMNTESVGKSRHTDYARKLLDGLEKHMAQTSGGPSAVDAGEEARRLRDEQGERASRASGTSKEKIPGAAGPYGQAFSGKGYCGGGFLRICC